MREALEEEDDYLDVDMDSHDLDQLDGAPTYAAKNSDRGKEDAIFVPFYPHLGGQDFDDEYVGGRSLLSVSCREGLRLTLFL